MKLNLNQAKVNESLSLITLIKRNTAECRIRDAGNGDVDVIYSKATRQNIESALERLEITVASMLSEEKEVAEEPPVPVVRVREAPLAIPAMTHVTHASATDQGEKPARSEANIARDKEIKEMLQQTPTQKQVSAIGANRDTVSRTVDVKTPFVTPPEEELRVDNEYLPVIPGTDARPVSPFERLTQNEYSELLRLFAPSPFLPEGHGVLSIPGDLQWHRDHDIDGMDGMTVVRLPAGAYGRNEKTGGPKYVMLRLQKAALLWNFEEGVKALRIFYIGRSNVSGYWLTPKHLTISEQISVISGLVDLRGRITAEKNGQEYTPVARLRD